MNLSKAWGARAARLAGGSCIFLTAFVALSATAQIQQAWVAKYNNGIANGTNQAVKMALDSSGNIYVTGVSQNTNTNLGYVTIKYAPNGNQLWAMRYDSTNYPSSMPMSLALDSSNDVFVTGNALTVKYDTNGNQLWTAPYAGTSLAVDTNGSCAVTGISTSFGTVKLDPNGTNLWVATYPSSYGPGIGQKILTAADNSIYVAGSYTFLCQDSMCYQEMLLIKYGSNGNPVWTSTYQSAGMPVQVGGAALDGANNPYFVASFGGGLNYETIKYINDGVLSWSVSPNNNFNSKAMGLVLDHSGNVLVTGMAKYFSAYFQYGTFQISNNGVPVWTNYYPQPPISDSVATSIAVDTANNSYVTGYSPGTNSGNDIVTIKYDPNGNQIWQQRYNGPSNGDDAGNAIAVDKNGNVYVTGYETTSAGGTEIVTIKYFPPLPAFNLQRHADGTVILQAQGSPGESFDIQASQDLLNWLDLGSVLADTNGLMQFDDTNAPTFPARFYLTRPQ